MTPAEKARKQRQRTYLNVDAVRDKLGTYVNQAAVDGERFVITRHGLPAAALVSMADLERLEKAVA